MPIQNKYKERNLIPLIQKLMVLLYVLYFGLLFSNEINITTSSKDISKETFLYIVPNTIITNTEQIHIDKDKVEIKARKKPQHFVQKEEKKGIKKIKEFKSVFHTVRLVNYLGKTESREIFAYLGLATNDRKKVFVIDSFMAFCVVFLFFFFTSQNQRDTTWWFLLGFYIHIYKSRPPPILQISY